MTEAPAPNQAEQSTGIDPKSKRNSGLFAIFKWFKSGSRESFLEYDSSRSSSLESVASDKSSGTVASFRFVAPNVYEQEVDKKEVFIGPETDTYRARLKQRDKRRESDKNVTLRKKYNLFFHRDTLLRPQKPLIEDDENSKSLPLMTRAHIMEVEPQKVHRRTISESSKIKRAGAYVHVKGKRKAPPPPGKPPSDTPTSSLKRKKRIAPAPPAVVANDYLKLDHGVLKPLKEDNNSPKGFNALTPSSSRGSFVEAPVSPRPWYKRNSTSKELLVKKENKYEPIERLPEVPFVRNSTLDLTLENTEKDTKRKSGMSFLTNISELDREAGEIMKNKVEYEKLVNAKNNLEIGEIPEFMKPKENKTDSWVTPKRRSARDLIAKFNAITSVTKVNVFGHKDKYFGKQVSLDETRQRQEQLLENHKKRIEDIDKKKDFTPLMKSESASAVKLGKDTPKTERKSWKCPKCNLENEYWRIICHVCSAIKPYFDDFASTPKNDVKAESPVLLRRDLPQFERSKTQIGFSALATYNSSKKDLNLSKVDDASKKEERERLKKMLIDMKNSLPNRKSNMLVKQNSRSSIIMENPEDEPKPEKTQEEKVAEILIGTQQTIYENIKVRKSENPRPVKVSSSAQTSAVVRKLVPEASLKKLIDNHKTNNVYEPMKVKDFEDIYSDPNGKNAAKVYANLAQNDLSLFFNVPKSADINKTDGRNINDTIEINRLLRRLENAISKGELTEASIFAKELAQLKVNCSVIRQKVTNGKQKGIQIEMYVEDKVSHRGPFPIEVTEKQTVAELKQQIAKEFEIPIEVQRWILGKELVVNDGRTLEDHKITEGCAVFLYLVAPEKSQEVCQPSTSGTKINPSTEKEAPKVVNVIPKSAEPSPSPSKHQVEVKVDIRPYISRFQEEKKELVRAISTKVEVLQAPAPIKPLDLRQEWECHLCTLFNPLSSNICSVCATVRIKSLKRSPKKNPAPQPQQTYLQLVNLDSGELVPNSEKFECLVCFMEVEQLQGVILRECLHQFCKECLARTVEYSDEPEVKCPYRDEEYSCNMVLQDREIKALVKPEVYEQHLAKSMAQAENQMEKTFHCKTPDCKGWCIFEDNVNEFRCPVCRKVNCLTCQAIHMGANCKQYQERMKDESCMNEEAKRTKDFLEEMVEKGEAIACPTCKVILMKKWGCDWLRCSMCKTEICWVTRGPRWGPGGKGDSSGGCQCGVNGVKCHPKCNYCH